MRRSRYFRAPPSADVSGGAATTCAICLQAVVTGASIACRHRFCFACIRAWADVSSTCPLCKVDIRAILDEATKTEVVVAHKVQAPPAENDDVAFADDDSALADDDFALALDDGSDGYEMDGFVVPNDFVEFADSEDEKDLRRDDDVDIPSLRSTRRRSTRERRSGSPRRKRIRRADSDEASSDDEATRSILLQPTVHDTMDSGQREQLEPSSTVLEPAPSTQARAPRVVSKYFRSSSS